ncbi:hypothetical protein BX600DRAFT_516518 [Xylariales sp. PMI_506]|nr:hypothetical protein BX600DRAFT_516518 [Xylariales sp. PMI_506]
MQEANEWDEWQSGQPQSPDEIREQMAGSNSAGWVALYVALATPAPSGVTVFGCPAPADISHFRLRNWATTERVLSGSLAHPPGGTLRALCHKGTLVWRSTTGTGFRCHLDAWEPIVSIPQGVQDGGMNWADRGIYHRVGNLALPGKAVPIGTSRPPRGIGRGVFRAGKDAQEAGCANQVPKQGSGSGLGRKGSAPKASKGPVRRTLRP